MTETMIPTTGYLAWLATAEPGDVFAVPIVGVVPQNVLYTGEPGEVPSVEYEPAVIDWAGNVHELRELERMSGYYFGGHLVGVAPARMSRDEALTYLGRFRVPLDPHAPGQADDEDMGTPLQRAQRQAAGLYTWPTPWEASAC